MNTFSILFFSFFLLCDIEIAKAVGNKPDIRTIAPHIKTIAPQNVECPIHFNSNGDLFVATTTDNKSVINGLNSEGGLNTLSMFKCAATEKNNPKVLIAEFSLDDRDLVTANDDGTLRWFSQGQEHQDKEHLRTEFTNLVPLLGHECQGKTWFHNWPSIGYETLIKFIHLHANKFVAVGSKDIGLHVYKLQRNNQLGMGKFMESSENVNSARFSKDGKYLIATWLGEDKNLVKLISVGDYALHEVDKIEHDDNVLTASFSSDGESVVTGSADGKVKISKLISAYTDKLSSKESKKFGETCMIDHGGEVYIAELSPDDKKLITLSKHPEHRLRIFEGKESREFKRILDVPFEKVHDLKFSSDGKKVIIAHADGNAAILENIDDIGKSRI